MLVSRDSILFSSFESLIQSVVPKKTSTDKVREYAEKVFPNIRSFLEKQMSDVLFLLDQVPLNTHLEDQRKPRIWTYKDPNGVRMIYIPDFSEARLREDGIREIMITEVFVSRVSQEPCKAKRAIALDYNCRGETNSLNQEIANRSIALNLPFGDQYFAPLRLTGVGLSFKCQEHERLTDSLSTLEFLQVLDGVFGGLKVLEEAGFVSLDITPDNIAVIRREDGSVEGKIDHFASLAKVGTSIKEPTNKRQNVLARKGYASFETDRYALILLIAESFFFNLKDHLDVNFESCEKHALKRIENFVSDAHYQQVVKLKALHGGFKGEFSQDLLNYVEEMKRQGEENFQVALLDKFAHNMAFFPEVADLLLKTMHADLGHLTLLNEGKSYEEALAANLKIPTLEEIDKALQPGKSKIETFQVEKESTQVTAISKADVEKIVYKVLPGERFHEADKCIDALYHVLNESLKCFPYVGSEVRVRRDVLWNDKGITSPFSFWLRVEIDKLILEIFDQNAMQPLGAGSFKKVKEGLQVVIVADGSLEFTPIAISRFKNGIKWNAKLAKSNKQLERLMQEPGALEFFAPPLKKHALYEGRRKQKLEAISARFEGTLNGSLKTHVINTKGGKRYLSKLDELTFLDNIGQGIKRMADKDLAHQDSKSSNIALILEKGRLTARIFDFDLITPCGNLGFPEAYYAWNALRSTYGYISKETDLYEYVLTFSETLLTGFSQWKSGESNETATLRLRTIARNVQSEKDKLKRQSKDPILKMFPHAFASDMKVFLSEFSESASVADVPDSFFDYIQTLPKETPIVGFCLKHFITEWLIFDHVFALLVKTLQADCVSYVKIEEKLKEIGIYSEIQSAVKHKNLESLDEQTQQLLKKAAEESLAEAEFPSYEEIQKTIELCKNIANEVEERSLPLKVPSCCLIS